MVELVSSNVRLSGMLQAYFFFLDEKFQSAATDGSRGWTFLLKVTGSSTASVTDSSLSDSASRFGFSSSVSDPSLMSSLVDLTAGLGNTDMRIRARNGTMMKATYSLPFLFGELAGLGYRDTLIRVVNRMTIVNDIRFTLSVTRIRRPSR